MMRAAPTKITLCQMLSRPFPTFTASQATVCYGDPARIYLLPPFPTLPTLLSCLTEIALLQVLTVMLMLVTYIFQEGKQGKRRSV